MNKTVNKDIPIPLYYQFKQILLDDIEQGKYAYGEKIPTEMEFINKYQISRTTIRQAINELVKEGYLVRYKSKGTIVNRRIKIEDSKLDIRHGVVLAGGTFNSKLIKLKKQKPELIDCKTLGINLNEEIWQMDRIRYSNNQPVSYSKTSIPVKYFPDLDMYENEANMGFHDLLKMKGLKVVATEHFIEVTKADSETAELLNSRKDDPMILLKDINYFKDGVIEWSLSVIPKTSKLVLHCVSEHNE